MASAVLYGKAPSREECFKVLDRVFELGCRFWDTAGEFCAPTRSTLLCLASKA